MLILADGLLVRAAALLHDGDRLADRAVGLEIAQQHDGVGQVADVDRADHRLPEEPVLRHHQERRDAPLPEIASAARAAAGQRPLLGHRVQVAVEAVDDDDPRPVLDGGRVTEATNSPGPISRGIDLREIETAAVDGRVEIEPQAGGRASMERLDPLVEGEQRDVLAALRRRDSA